MHVFVKLNNAIALWIAHMIPEDSRAVFLFAGTDKQIFKAIPKENIIAENQARMASPDKICCKEKCLRYAFRFFLNDIFKRTPPLTAVSEKLAILPHVVWSRNDGNLADAGQHEHRQRIINHRLVVDRQKLLADAQRQGMQPCPGTASQQDTFSRNHVILSLLHLHLVSLNGKPPSGDGIIYPARFCPIRMYAHSRILSSRVIDLHPSAVLTALDIPYPSLIVKMPQDGFSQAFFSNVCVGYQPSSEDNFTQLIA